MGNIFSDPGSHDFGGGATNGVRNNKQLSNSPIAWKSKSCLYTFVQAGSFSAFYDAFCVSGYCPKYRVGMFFLNSIFY